MKSHFRMFARYNRWANERVYEAAAALSDAQYREDRGAFFKSVRGTLNHLLVADMVWMRRFTGTGKVPGALDTILHDALADLRAARAAQDGRIIAHMDGLSEADLHGLIRYRRITSPEDVEQPRGKALAHFFNHQTHHRGQVHALLTGLTGTAPELDLLYFQRTNG